MKTHISIACILPVLLWLTGCVLDPTGISQMVHANKVQQDHKVIQQRQKLSLAFQKNPDTDAWYEQRQKTALAIGDRDFDRDYGRVFDSLMVAVASLELKVNNMERQSGYISGSGIALPPTEARQLRREAVNEWCRQSGFDPSILDQPLQTSEMRDVGEMADIGSMMARYDKMQKGLTFQLVNMGDSRTKVKLRFSDVYYPAEVESYYQLVWQAVDKQLFVDHNVEGAVESRR